MRTDTTYNTAAYNRGWRTSYSGLSGSALDRADARHEPEEWYDGYFDAGAGRTKWHLRHCTNHSNKPGGCGEA